MHRLFCERRDLQRGHASQQIHFVNDFSAASPGFEATCILTAGRGVEATVYPLPPETDCADPGLPHKRKDVTPQCAAVMQCLETLAVTSFRACLLLKRAPRRNNTLQDADTFPPQESYRYVGCRRLRLATLAKVGSQCKIRLAGPNIIAADCSTSTFE